jgi:hypothetical protein
MGVQGRDCTENAGPGSRWKINSRSTEYSQQAPRQPVTCKTCIAVVTCNPCIPAMTCLECLTPLAQGQSLFPVAQSEGPEQATPAGCCSPNLRPGVASAASLSGKKS